MMIKKHYYTAEEDEWLRQHISSCETYNHLTEMFNEHFKENVKSQSISDRCIKMLHIYMGRNKGQFTKGHGNCPCPKNHKLGAEIERGGYIFVKYNNVRHTGKISYQNMKENWVPKQRYVYEQYHGSIPKGYIVVFLDNDKNNFSPENLYAIPRKINAIMNQNKWFTSNRENTLTAIKWCELFYALKGVR